MEEEARAARGWRFGLFNSPPGPWIDGEMSLAVKAKGIIPKGAPLVLDEFGYAHVATTNSERIAGFATQQFGDKDEVAYISVWPPVKR